MSTYWDQYKTQIPEGKVGSACISKFSISEKDAAYIRMRAAATGGRERPVPLGTYTKLEVNGHLWMSDTQAEILDHLGFIHMAKGNVLITGLGLGIVAEACLQKPEVTHVTVIEKHPDVYALVAPYLHNKWAIQFKPKLRIVNADAYIWTPTNENPIWPKHFDYAWHDIWQDICADNVEGMKKLKRHYSKFVVAGKQHCWQEQNVKRLHRQWVREEKQRDYWRSYA